MNKNDIANLKKEVNDLYNKLSLPSQIEQKMADINTLQTKLQYSLPTIYQSSNSKLDSKVKI